MTAPSNANTSGLAVERRAELYDHMKLVAEANGFKSLTEAIACATSAQARNAEASMLAYKWMEAHDRLKAGLDYDLPSPADVPAEKARADRLAKALERIAYTPSGMSGLSLSDCISEARAALQQETQK